MYDLKQSSKEVIRHILFCLGLGRVFDKLREWRGARTRHLSKSDMGEIFSHIYKRKVWVRQEDQESLSGLGSTKVATREVVVQLSAFLRDVGCRKLIDIGCGDFNWMRDVEGDFDYLGIDVVPEVVAANQAQYTNTKRQFACLDATLSVLDSGDVAVCREILFHLSFRDGLRLLRNIKAAEFKYVLITNDKNIWFNSNIRNGDFRHINLSKSPYRLPKPLSELTDEGLAPGRVLAVFPSAALPG